MPGLLDAIGLFADEELAGTVEDRFIAVGLDFAQIVSSSSFCSCTLFAIVSGQLIKLDFLAQQVELKWLSLAFPNTAVGFTTAVYWCFARHCRWHRNFQLPTSVFSWMVCFYSSSSGSKKKIPRNCLALSNFGFSIVHFCVALLFAASDICFHISGHTLSSPEVVCFLVSLLSGPCISIRWPFIQQHKSCEACLCI